MPMLVPQNRKIVLKHPESHSVSHRNSVNQESATKSDYIGGAHAICGLDRPLQVLRNAGVSLNAQTLAGYWRSMTLAAQDAQQWVRAL